MIENRPKFLALGLMSGTSLDGIDVALIETDGYGYVKPLGFMSTEYEPAFREKIRACLWKSRGEGFVDEVEHDQTILHAEAVKLFLKEKAYTPSQINFVGFHGQTLWHKPTEGQTLQIGDGQLLADSTGIPVVYDFRSADVKDGGQGAPLIPVYHRALSSAIARPTAILNIGGVSNITWMSDKDDEMLGFDTGPGNAKINDWVKARTGQEYDKDGKLAFAGKVNEAMVNQLLTHPYFNQKPPKSLDRNDFDKVIEALGLEKLSTEDGAATLTMITVRTILESLKHVPQKPAAIYLTGGGRLNPAIKQWLGDCSGIKIGLVDDLNWSGDGLEAEGFAYMAVRTHLKLPISFPGTTGVRTPKVGGVLVVPKVRRSSL